LIAVARAEFLGAAWGNRGKKFNYLPEVYGDSIFAVMAKRLVLFLTPYLSYSVFLFFIA